MQKLIDVVHAYCHKWRLKANLSKSAVMVFAKDIVDGSWSWGEHKLPRVSKYTIWLLIFSVVELGMSILRS